MSTTFLMRSDSNNLHREGLPAVDMGHLKQYWWLGKLHNSRGPAVVSDSGTSLYYWRGIHIPHDLWHNMHEMDAQQVMSMSNAELRRCVIERVGLTKLVDKAKLMDEECEPGVEEPNRLYKLRLEGDEDLVFLRLVNSTPEDDGTRKIYFLRIPPNIRTVKEGIAWTFEIDKEKTYKFISQS